MLQQAYFGQVEKNINSLIADQKYKEAHRLCKEYLEKFPQEKKLLKMKKKIEKIVRSENTKVVKEEIKKTKPLWKEKQYAEIIKILKPLIEADPGNNKIKRLAIKAQDAYREEVQKLKNNFEKEQTERFDMVLKNQPSQLLDELSELERDNPGNPIAKGIIQKYKTALIRNRIKEKEELIYSDKYDSIHSFIDQLRIIDKNNSVINELEDLTRRRQHGNQVDEKNEFVYKSKSHLITLMQLKKYNKAVMAATELLETEKDNQEIIKILKKAEKKLFKINREKTISLIQDDIVKQKAEYEKDPSSFVRL